MSNARDQYFQDFHQADFGTLGGADAAGGNGNGGADSLDQVKTTVTPQGIQSKCMCESCGTTNAVIVEYPEAVAGSREMVPPNWRVAAGLLYAEVGCAKCRSLVAVGYTPAELNSLVLIGVKQGFYPAGQYQAQVQQVEEAKARAGFGRR